jgi:RND family efflux transporter MFP subunit
MPTVHVVRPRRAAEDKRLVLPGTAAALVEAPIYARATGYISRRLVDIGDRVRQGQLMAVIDSPDLDRQVEQARATVLQSESTVEQMKAQLRLAEVTRDRYRVLVAKGVLSRQEGDTQEANYEVAVANLKAAEQTVNANRASLNRLIDLQQYERVIAPFDGLVTARNIDVGALISTSGSSSQGGELFRVAGMDRLRIFINVPEPYAASLNVGQKVQIQAGADPQKMVIGKLTRTADAVDPATRTMLTEIQIDNRGLAFLPGMFIFATLIDVRAQPPLMVPSDSLLTPAGGPRLAVVRQDVVHMQPVRVGRDTGPAIEILDGLQDDDLVVTAPNDRAREGARVQVKLEENPPGKNP